MLQIAQLPLVHGRSVVFRERARPKVCDVFVARTCRYALFSENVGYPVVEQFGNIWTLEL